MCEYEGDSAVKDDELGEDGEEWDVRGKENRGFVDNTVIETRKRELQC